MSTNPAELTDKKVAVKLKNGETFEGKVLAANDLGYLVAKTHNSTPQLFTNDLIEEIVTVEAKAKAATVDGVRRVRRDPLTEETVFKHLLREHGYPISWVNDTTPEAALAHHDGEVDHADLVHFHAEKKSAESED